MFSTRGFIFILLLSLSVTGAPTGPSRWSPDWPVEPNQPIGRRSSSLPPGVPEHARNLFHPKMKVMDPISLIQAPLFPPQNPRKRKKPRQGSPDSYFEPKTKTSPGELSDKPQPEPHNKQVKPGPKTTKSPGEPSNERRPEAHNQPINPTSPGMLLDKHQPEAHNQLINPVGPKTKTSPGKSSDEPLPIHNKPVGLSLGKPQPEAHSGQAEPVPPGMLLSKPQLVHNEANPRPASPPGLPMNDEHHEHDVSI
ncbi:hypothetical protein APHAL10511_000746 [Amanita phalloides]|nr:hypothetical protein APHAL10511_000746 [Amanita phalloides]